MRAINIKYLSKAHILYTHTHSLTTNSVLSGHVHILNLPHTSTLNDINTKGNHVHSEIKT